jgi:hypothetical protein
MKSIPSNIEAYCDIIASIINGCCFSSYLELGIYDGNNLGKIVLKCPNLKSATGVDIRIESEITLKPTGIIKIHYGTTTDKFFAENTKIFDVVFIDACHNYKNVISDFDNIMRFLEDDGIIFLHDTYPPNLQSLDPGYCSDAYRAYFDILLDRKDICECVN